MLLSVSFIFLNVAFKCGINLDYVGLVLQLRTISKFLLINCIDFLLSSVQKLGILFLLLWFLKCNKLQSHY
uniref:Uncharacterized protein n=1 Tax=Triatoma infestans TaxID=30076 RepID=A0A161M4F8_TRIIF